VRVKLKIPDWAVMLVSDHTDMDRNPLRLKVGSGRHLEFSLPDDVYFEYGYIDSDGRVRADPNNPVVAANPWYAALSALTGSTYKLEPSTDPPTSNGELKRYQLNSSLFKTRRRFAIFSPDDVGDRPLPIVIVQDGPAFLRIGQLDRILESLVRAGLAHPARLVFVEPGDRTIEYLFSPTYNSFISQELLPFLDSEVPLQGKPILIGASLGGLVSATIALQDPECYQGVVTLSGAFLGTPADPDPYNSAKSWVIDRIKEGVGSNLRWSLDVGTFEWLLDVNRNVREALRSSGVTHRYQEWNAGHNWVNWSNCLGRALSFSLATKDFSP
jgi:enterochelin esterase-like enzyme